MYRIELKRTLSGNKQTTGEFTLFVDQIAVLTGATLELPWFGNQTNVSCIPTGRYKLQPFNSIKFGRCLQVMNVPGRYAILLHKGNYNKDTHGCILVGSKHADINSDGLLDVIESGKTMDKIMSLIAGEGEIIISL